jgi:tetratricopeptide (TPR) repeat protein
MAAPSPRRALRRFCWFLLVLVLCGAAASAAAQLRAWYHFRAVQSALTCYHFAQARDHLAIPLKTWPTSWRVHLLAARAARLDGAAEEAREHLHFCQQKQANAKEVLLEWALLRAQVGELEAVEGYLLDELRRGSDQTLLIQEALIEGYTRTYRIGPALAGVEDWLKQRPDDTQALYLRGCLYQQVQRPQMALASYRRIMELDSQREDARWRLSQCLLRLGLYEEANPHLEYLHRHYPQNAEMTVELAGARFKQGQLAEARQLLDSVLAEHPDNEAALRERGRLAMEAEDAARAEKWLRQAEQINPHDAQLLPLLVAALEHQGKHDEAQVLQDRLKQNDRDFQRLAEICLRELGERPNDPDLHSELGALLRRLGYREAARSWLLLALQEDPNSASARAALEGTNVGSISK